MSFSYPKSAKLKSKITIDQLFSVGQSVAKYPLRLVFVRLEGSEVAQHKVGVSVSKKYFKRAVDRNYFKRVLRECYRQNQTLLHQNLDCGYAFMFFYQSKDRLPFAEIELKTRQLFEKFASVAGKSVDLSSKEA